MAEESGDHQYAVLISSSSGYTQSSSPLRISSVPPLVTACSLPLATFASHRLWSRTKLTNFPSVEILGSAIAALPETRVRATCDFSSNQASAVGPWNRMPAPSGAHWYCAGARRPRPVACVGFELSAGRIDSILSAATRSRRSPEAASIVQSSVLV